MPVTEVRPWMFQPVVAPARLLPPRFEPPRLLPATFDPPRLLPPRLVPPRFAPPRFAPPRFAPPRFAPPRFAPPRFAPPRLDPPRFAPPRFAPPRFSPCNGDVAVSVELELSSCWQATPSSSVMARRGPGPDEANLRRPQARFCTAFLCACSVLENADRCGSREGRRNAVVSRESATPSR